MPQLDGTITARMLASRSIGSRHLADVQSSDFSSGVSGWRIRKDGSAEFNNVTIRGSVIATTGELTDLSVSGTLSLGGVGKIISATSGLRVVITSTHCDRISFYSGGTGESRPAFVQTYWSSGYGGFGSGVFTIASPAAASNPDGSTVRAQIQMGPQGMSFYVADEEQLRLTERTIRPAATAFSLGSTGIGAFANVYMAALRDEDGSVDVDVSTISYGTADSGGAGYKVLRVPN
jgi:hypothetical protein